MEARFGSQNTPFTQTSVRVSLSTAIQALTPAGLFPGRFGLPFLVHFTNPVSHGRFPGLGLVGNILDETSWVKARFLGHTDILSREATAVLRLSP